MSNQPESTLNTEENADQQQQVSQEASNTAQSDATVQETVDVQALEQQIAQLQKEVAAEKERALRAMAETDNLRRRTVQDVEKAHKFALEKFASELLPVLDNLERALEHVDANDEALQTLVQGIDLTLKSFLAVTTKFGIEVIDPKGELLDPNKHQAVSMLEVADATPNTIVDVMQKGYELNGRILRPAMVIVAKVSVDA